MKACGALERAEGTPSTDFARDELPPRYDCGNTCSSVNALRLSPFFYIKELNQ